MSESTKIKFWQSLRFKLALTYTLIIFVCFGAFIAVFNLYMRAYFFQQPQETTTIVASPFLPPVVIERFSRLQAAEQARIIDIRRRDFERIQLVSLLALFPILLISTTIGYLLSDDLLNPLKLLHAKIATRSSKNLDEGIDYSGPDDEVGRIIKSFNTMSQSLHSVFRQQEEFVQNASHELKTPLAIQQANLELLQDNYKPGTEEYEALHTALGAITRMQRLIEALLTLSEPQSQDRKSVDIPKLLNDVIAELKPLAKESKVGLKIEDAAKSVAVEANRSQLYTALLGIVENAIKYTKGSKPAEVSIAIKATKTKLKIEIADTGPGIPTDSLPFIFERFYRVDNSRSRETGGHGLGLAIAQKIIYEHGGEIEAESTTKGTTFIVIFNR
jgi:signal transduction histidine kinase